MSDEIAIFIEAFTPVKLVIKDLKLPLRPGTIIKIHNVLHHRTKKPRLFIVTKLALPREKELHIYPQMIDVGEYRTIEKMPQGLEWIRLADGE